jgi:uncharacterized protein RhaS with RHS repeats
VSSADWYDPQTGRFLSQDPIGLAGGVNLYAYAGNNPSSYSDPFGLCIDSNDPDCSLGQRIANKIKGFFSSMAGRAVNAMAGAVAVMGQVMSAPVPGAGNASEALSGVSAEDGASLSGGQRTAAAAMAIGEIVTAPIEVHHLLPRQFKAFFSEAGLDIEEYTMKLSRDAHRTNPSGLHTKSGGDWNGVWKKWISENPNATQEQILGQLDAMKGQFGLQ